MAENAGSAAGPGRYLRNYQYDTRIRERYGIVAALVHQEILRRCAYNQAEAIAAVKIGGKYYMYTTAQRIADHLGYTERTIERALKKLYAAGLIQKETRWGTKVHNGNPNALLYYAEEYGEFAHQAETPNRSDIVSGQIIAKSEANPRACHLLTSSQAYVEEKTPATRSKEAAAFRERVKARSKTKPRRGTYVQNGHRVRSADGPQPIAQAIDQVIGKPPENIQPEPRKPKPLSPEQIRINEADKAAQAAEAEKTLPAALRNLATSLLESRDVPQIMREMMEAAIQREIKNPDVLRAWINDLQAMPKPTRPKLIAETEPEAAAEAAG